MTPPELDVLLLRDAAQERLVEAVPEGERHEPCRWWSYHAAAAPAAAAAAATTTTVVILFYYQY